MLLFPDLPSLKLVEPGRDEGVVRVETMVRVSGVLGSGLCTGCRWWFRLSRSFRSRAGSTSFREVVAARLNQFRQGRISSAIRARDEGCSRAG